MKVKEQRRSQRIRFELAVELLDKRGTTKLRALDVARHGLLLATDDPPRERHLVQLVVHLPEGPIRAAASVTRTLRGENGASRGVGVQFFALSDDAKRRWDDFIFALQRRPIAPRVHPAAAAGEAPYAPSGATFLVRLKSQERLRDFKQTHLAAGGTVLFTPVLRAPGEVVTLIVVHPKSDEEFRLPGIIHKAHTDRPKRLEIHFHGVTPALLNSFAAYVETGQPPVLHLEPPLANNVLPLVPAGDEQRDLDLDVDVFDEDTLDTDERVWRPPGELGHLDPGWKPSTFLVRCDRCEAEPYALDLGPCRGVLGLVADHTPFQSVKSGRVVTAPRLAPAEERRARTLRYLDGGGRLDATVDLMTLLGAVALVDPPRDPDTGGALKQTRGVERLTALALKLAIGDAPARTRVACSSCKTGHLLVERITG